MLQGRDHISMQGRMHDEAKFGVSMEALEAAMNAHEKGEMCA